ncbi:AAA family ATPase [Bifidobacterium simiiventris]|uniref:AAA family ATPase n=1 Tax=Bifidobacterium simiiventris TaxID=2834434 RepID=UPI001C5729A7|nr:AAA family ATPase [Bifidobacterium simiiventris]MBW3079445.1 AAA family ATPase [Bifidobacterium simiiventris]
MTIDFDMSALTLDQRATLTDYFTALDDMPATTAAHTLAVPYKGRTPLLVPASTVAKQRPRFLDYPMIPTGTLTLMAGRAGVSKSTLSLYRAALATRGLLDGDWKGKPATVAISGIEDSKSIQRMRLEAAGADLDRVRFLSMLDTNSDGNGTDTGVRLPDDLPALADSFRAEGVRLWIIDPITSCMDGDSNKRDDVRRALDPLAALADDLDMAIVGILHFNKGGGYASDKISGSHAFRDVIRSLVLIAKDDDNGDCVATIDKSSYTTAQGTSYSYGLMSVDVADDHGETFAVPKVTGFMKTERDVNEVINRNIQAAGGDTTHTERGEVLEWLTDYLKDGPVAFKDIAAAANVEGYSRRQLTNARERSDGRIITVPDPTYEGRGQKRLWALADTTAAPRARGGTERGSNHGSNQTPMIATPPITSANTSAFQAPARARNAEQNTQDLGLFPESEES